MSYSILYNQDNVPHPHSDQNLEFLYIFQIFITWQVPVLSGHITIQELFPNLWFKSDSSTMSAGAPNRPRPAVHCNRRQTLSLGQEQSCGWTRSDERLGGSQVPLLYPTLKHTHPCWSNFIVFHPYSHSFGHPRFRLKRFQYMYTCIYTVYIYICIHFLIRTQSSPCLESYSRTCHFPGDCHPALLDVHPMPLPPLPRHIFGYPQFWSSKRSRTVPYISCCLYLRSYHVGFHNAMFTIPITINL